MFGIAIQYPIGDSVALFTKRQGWLAFEVLVEELKNKREVAATYYDTETHAHYRMNYSEKRGLEFR